MCLVLWTQAFSLQFLADLTTRDASWVAFKHFNYSQVNCSRL